MIEQEGRMSDYVIDGRVEVDGESLGTGDAIKL
jgi:hypothetical protein